MSERENQNRQVPVPMHQPKQPAIITIGGTTSLDLDSLPEEQRNQLMSDYAKGMVNIALRAQELGVDVSVLKNTLTGLADTTKQVSEAGNAVTISHTQTTTAGRTEIKMGNTDDAKSGKLTRSQTGETDWTPYYIFAGIAAIILIAVVMSR
jgi:hypothetical protein